jgi:hypothetical protein
MLELMKHLPANFLRCSTRLERNENMSVGRKVSKLSRRPRMFLAGLTIAVAVLSGAQLGATPRSDTLQAINWVENPLGTTRAGTYGELGAYQFKESTWRMHTQRPFADANDRRVSDEVAVAHYEWLKAALERAGVEPTTYNIALAWNAGVSAVIKRHAPAVAHNYATRVNNLATDLGMRQLVAAK